MLHLLSLNYFLFVFLIRITLFLANISAFHQDVYSLKCVFAALTSNNADIVCRFFFFNHEENRAFSNVDGFLPNYESLSSRQTCESDTISAVGFFFLVKTMFLKAAGDFSTCRWCWIPSWLPSWCPTSQLQLKNAEDMMLRCENETIQLCLTAVVD